VAEAERIDLAWMREYAEKCTGAKYVQYVHFLPSEVLALVETVETAKATLAAIDRALDASRVPETRRHLMFCVGATLELRESLDRFVEQPSSGGTA
jgi:hypothetical protein